MILPAGNPGGRGLSFVVSSDHEALSLRAAELVAAGATILYEMTELGQFWITMADPEGNEFCVG